MKPDQAVRDARCKAQGAKCLGIRHLLGVGSLLTTPCSPVTVQLLVPTCTRREPAVGDTVRHTVIGLRSVSTAQEHDAGAQRLGTPDRGLLAATSGRPAFALKRDVWTRWRVRSSWHYLHRSCSCLWQSGKEERDLSVPSEGQKRLWSHTSI